MDPFLDMDREVRGRGRLTHRIEEECRGGSGEDERERVGGEEF